MNKKTLRIAGWALGLSMAVAGIGTIAGMSAKSPIEAVAEGETWAATTETYKIVTSASQLTDGSKVVLISTNAAKGVGAQGSNNRSAADVTKSGSGSTRKVTAKSNSTLAQFTIGSVTVDTKKYFTLGVDGKNLYNASTSSKNYARTDTYASVANGRADWTITIDGSTYIASINSRTAESSKTVLSFNPSSSYITACYASLQSNGGIEIYKLVDELDSSLTLGGTKKTSFNVGDTFSLGESLTITANYSIAGATAIALNDSGLSFTLGGEAVTTSTVLTIADNGKSLVISYTDAEGNTATATGYGITVNYAPVTSVSISTYPTSDLALVGSFTFAADVLPATANPDVTWSVAKKSGEIDAKEFEINEDTGELIVTASKAGVLTVTATTVGHDALDAVLTDSVDVVVSGEPICHLKDVSAVGYKTKTVDLEFDSVENMSAPTSYLWTVETGGSYVSIEGDNDEESVTLNCLAVGVSTVKLTVSDGEKEAEATATVTVSDYTVSSVTWSASNLNVYSGSNLTTSIADDWNVTYTMNNGDEDIIDHESFTVKLGGVAIDLPHVWTIDDDGKTLCAVYEGVSTSTVTVNVCEALNAINADLEVETSTVFTSVSWGTLDSSWTSGSAGNGWTDGQGVQVTTAKTGANATSKSTFNDIKQIVVTYNTNKDAGAGSIDIKIGSNAVKSNAVGYAGSGDGRSANYTTTFDYSTKQSGQVKLTCNTTTNSIWVKSITIITSSSSTNIANTNFAVQKDLLNYATTFNETMACVSSGATENVATKWGSVSSAFSTLLGKYSAGNLSHLKRMVAYATPAQTGGDTLQDMLARYDYIIAKYNAAPYSLKLTDFLNTTAQRPEVLEAAVINHVGLEGIKDDSSVFVVVAAAAIGFATVGSFFFIQRKRRSED